MRCCDSIFDAIYRTYDEGQKEETIDAFLQSVKMAFGELLDTGASVEDIEANITLYHRIVKQWPNLKYGTDHLPYLQEIKEDDYYFRVYRCVP